MKNNIYIGTSGYMYKSWNEKFFPKDLPKTKWLPYFSEHFKTLEINATFYGWFQKKTFEKWRNETTKDFKFAIKGPRRITHLQKLKEVEEITHDFFENASGLEEKLLVVLWQFPKSFQYKEEYFERLKEFLKILPKKPYQVIELRHASWFTDEVFALLKKYNVGFVMSDTKAFDTTEAVTGKVVYFRFHGPEALYSSTYTTDQLKEIAKKIKSYGKDHIVCCYFNNDASTFAVENSKELERLTT